MPKTFFSGGIRVRWWRERMVSGAAFAFRPGQIGLGHRFGFLLFSTEPLHHPRTVLFKLLKKQFRHFKRLRMPCRAIDKMWTLALEGRWSGREAAFLRHLHTRTGLYRIGTSRKSKSNQSFSFNPRERFHPSFHLSSWRDNTNRKPQIDFSYISIRSVTFHNRVKKFFSTLLGFLSGLWISDTVVEQRCIDLFLDLDFSVCQANENIYDIHWISLCTSQKNCKTVKL